MKNECKPSCTLHFKRNLRSGVFFFFFLGGENFYKQSLNNIHGWRLYLNWTDKKVKTKNTRYINIKFNVLDCSTPFFTCHPPNKRHGRSWTDLKGLRVTEGKITLNLWNKSRGNRFWCEFNSEVESFEYFWESNSKALIGLAIMVHEPFPCSPNMV